MSDLAVSTHGDISLRVINDLLKGESFARADFSSGAHLYLRKSSDGSFEIQHQFNYNDQEGQYRVETFHYDPKGKFIDVRAVSARWDEANFKIVANPDSAPAPEEGARLLNRCKAEPVTWYRPDPAPTSINANLPPLLEIDYIRKENAKQ